MKTQSRPSGPTFVDMRSAFFWLLIACSIFATLFVFNAGSIRTSIYQIGTEGPSGLYNRSERDGIRMAVVDKKDSTYTIALYARSQKPANALALVLRFPAKDVRYVASSIKASKGWALDSQFTKLLNSEETPGTTKFGIFLDKDTEYLSEAEEEIARLSFERLSTVSASMDIEIATLQDKTNTTSGTYTKLDTTTSKDLISRKLIFSEAEPVVERKAAPVRYSDVPDRAYYREALDAFTQASIVSGYSDNSFRPNQGVTRAEALKLLLMSADVGSYALKRDFEIFKLVHKDYTYAYFKDVTFQSWYAQYVKYAFENKIISQNGENKFYPERGISRAEVIKMITSVYKLPTSDTSMITFHDVLPSAWYSKYVYAASDAGILKQFALENPTQLFPNKEITRSEIVYMLYLAQHN